MDLRFIAHSFVRHQEDIKAIQQILDEEKSPIKIIAKIENREGVENIEDNLEHCYGITFILFCRIRVLTRRAALPFFSSSRAAYLGPGFPFQVQP